MRICSACPEKILEFKDKKSQLKKQKVQNRRPKKTGSSSSMAEVDQKLKNLLLDINLGDNANLHNASNLPAQQVFDDDDAAAVDEADLNSQDLFHSSYDFEQIGKNQSLSNSSDHQGGSSIVENEVIDLLSPTPAKQSHNSSKFQQLNGQRIEMINLSDSENDETLLPEHRRNGQQHIEMINLSDSENDISPEHGRKAKELRMFMGSIRNDIH